MHELGFQQGLFLLLFPVSPSGYNLVTIWTETVDKLVKRKGRVLVGGSRQRRVLLDQWVETVLQRRVLLDQWVETVLQKVF